MASRSMPVAARLFAIAVLSTVALIVVVTIEAVSISNSLKEQKQLELKHLVENAIGVLDGSRKQAMAGEFSEDEAKTRAYAIISQMRYGNGDYFWINDLNNVIMMHAAKPELNGKDLTGLKDPDGVYIFQEFNKVVKQAGGGYVYYAWPKPGSDAPVAKSSYVQGYEPWGLIVGTGVYVDDLQAQIWSTVISSIVVVGIVAMLLATLTLLIARTVTRPLARLRDAMTGLTAGETEVDLGDAARGDEIGQMGRAVSVFRDNILERARLEEAQSSDRQAREARQAKIEKLIEQFRGEVQSLLEAVNANTGDMQNAAKSLADIAQKTTAHASSATQSSERASENVQTVASAAEELSASIEEISRQVEQTTNVVSEASHNARETNSKVESLAESAQKIGDVVALIQDIAEQTNLLALNATIEAARAGEMGKGFAVVAAEVKSLANQTAKATEEISGQISEIQTATGDAVQAIQGITKTMEVVNSHASGIAASVSEQGAATEEISRSVRDAAEGTQETASVIQVVSKAVDETGRSAAIVNEAATSVTEQTKKLRGSVDHFLREVAAA